MCCHPPEILGLKVIFVATLIYQLSTDSRTLLCNFNNENIILNFVVKNVCLCKFSSVSIKPQTRQSSIEFIRNSMIWYIQHDNTQIQSASIGHVSILKLINQYKKKWNCINYLDIFLLLNFVIYFIFHVHNRYWKIRTVL